MWTGYYGKKLSLIFFEFCKMEKMTIQTTSMKTMKLQTTKNEN